MRLRPALDSAKVPRAGVSSQPSSGAVSRRRRPYFSLCDLTPPAQGPSGPRLARAASHAVRLHPALDSAKVPRAGVSSRPSSGAVSRRRRPYFSLCDLTPPAQRPSGPRLARAASHAVRLHPALDSARVPRAGVSSLPSSGAVSRRKRPQFGLSDLTPPAQGPSRPRLARAASHAVRLHPALDSAKVPRAGVSSLPSSGAVSRRKRPQFGLGDLTPSAQGPSRPRLARAASPAVRLHPALDSAKVPRAGVSSQPSSGAASRRRRPYFSLCVLTPPAQRPSGPRLARAACHAVRVHPAMDSPKVPRAGVSSLPSSGAVSRRRRPYFSLCDLTPPAQRPSRPGLARAACHAVRLHPALDSAKVPRAGVSSLPSSGAVSRRKRPKFGLSDPTPPAQGPSRPRLARAACHAVRLHPALDSAKVPRAGVSSQPSSGAVSRRRRPYFSLCDLTPPAQRPSRPRLARAACHAVRLHPALDSPKVPRAGVSSQPSSGAVSRRRRPHFSLCVLTPPAQGPSGPRLARAASRAVRLHPALDSAKVPRAGVSSQPSSGAVSRRRRPYFSLCVLTPPAQGPSGPRLARAASHAVRLHPALDSAKVPRAGVSSLPSSGAVSRRKRPQFGLSDLTPPAQGPSWPRLARAACHAVRLHPALDSPKVPRAGVSSQPSSGAVSRRRRPYFSLCVLTPPAQRPSGPRLARAACHAVRVHPAMDSPKVPRAGVSSLPSSGAVSRRRRPYFSLCDLTPPAQRPSRPGLARAACHAVRLHPALDSAKVPRAGVSSLPSSGAVSRRKRPKFGLSDPTPPAQGPSRPRLARAACHAVRLHPALDSAKVPRAGVSSQPSSGAVSRRRRPYFSLCDLTPPAQRPSRPRLARAACHAVRLHPALDSPKVPRAGVSSQPSSGAVSRRRRPHFSLCVLTPPAQGPSGPRLARAASRAVRLHPALDSAKVPRAGVSSQPSSGAVSRRRRPYFSLCVLTPPAQGPSGPRLARAASHAVRLHPALDSAKVPRAGVSSLPSSGAVSRRKRPQFGLSDLTPPAQGPSWPRLARAACHAVRLHPALDSPKVPRAGVSSQPSSGAVSRRRRPYFSLCVLTPPAQRPSGPRLARAACHAVRLHPALDSPKVPRAGVSSQPSSGAVSRRRRPHFSLCVLTPPAQGPSGPRLARAASHAVRLHPALDSAKVPRAGVSSLPSSGAVSRRKRT